MGGRAGLGTENTLEGEGKEIDGMALDVQGGQESTYYETWLPLDTRIRHITKNTGAKHNESLVYPDILPLCLRMLYPLRANRLRSQAFVTPSILAAGTNSTCNDHICQPT